MQRNLYLSEIFIYPIKSLGGISLKESFVEKKGLQFDRRMMLVDENGLFMTQRTYPKMALFKTQIQDDFLIVTLSNSDYSIKLSLMPEITNGSQKIKVKIYSDDCYAIKVSNEADDFFSEILSTKCQLVYMPENQSRVVDKDKKYVQDDHSVSFADGFPFLIIGQASLDELNRRLSEPISMNRFRTNFVFANGRPFEEDNWKDFFIGDIKFRAVKPCARCVITTIEQETAIKSEEPLKTLSTFRKFDNKILFGMNLVTYGEGKVKVGDSIKIE